MTWIEKIGNSACDLYVYQLNTYKTIYKVSVPDLKHTVPPSDFQKCRMGITIELFSKIILVQAACHCSCTLALSMFELIYFSSKILQSFYTQICYPISQLPPLQQFYP
jgi:hypothetical protein